MKQMLLACVAMLLAKAAIADPVDKLTFLTEQYPPYNMKVDGTKKGLSVDLIREIFRNTETKTTVKDVQFVPWARGYQMALHEENTVLFSTTRTEKREDKFIWVGPIAATRIGIVGPKDAPDVESLEDLYEARIATIRDDVAEQMLLQKAIPKDSIHSTSNFKSIIRLLESGRVNYWAYETNVAMHTLKNNGVAEDYETKFVLIEAELYYALNKDTDPAAVKAFRDAFQTVRNSDRYDAIMDKYLK